MDTEEEELIWAAEEMSRLLDRVRSCMLATISAGGRPLSSYAPVWVSAERRFYVYVSAMAKHYGHLRKTGRASLSLIEDEAAAEEIFARKRLTLDCSALRVDRACAEWQQAMGGLEERHGSIVSYLKDLLDFDLFRLSPEEGRLVLGFGKAYRVSGDDLNQVSYLGAGGHRKRN